MNEGDVLFEQAASALRGTGGKRDLAAARDLFRRSGEAGRGHAAVIHANFVAAGVGALLPVTAGQKWIASRWIRARAFELPIEGAA